MSSISEYRNGLGDIALPPNARQAARSRQLFDQILQEGPRRGADRLIGFLQSHGVVDVEFSVHGLRAIDRWIASVAVVEIEDPPSKTPLDTPLTEPWRDFAVDMFLLAGELTGTYLRDPRWELSDASKGDTWRLLPGIQDATAPDPPPGLESSPIYNNLVFAGRTQAGVERHDVVATFRKTIQQVERLVALGPPTHEYLAQQHSLYPTVAWDRPAVPPMPQSSRVKCFQAIRSGRAGSFGELIVFAPMSLEQAQEQLEEDEYEPSALAAERPPQELIDFVTALYRKWPHVTGDPELASVWTRDLYDGIGRNSASIVSSREAPSGPVFKAVIDLAKEHGMPVYSVEGDEWFS